MDNYHCFLYMLQCNNHPMKTKSINDSASYKVISASDPSLNWQFKLKWKKHLFNVELNFVDSRWYNFVNFPANGGKCLREKYRLTYCFVAGMK